MPHTIEQTIFSFQYLCSIRSKFLDKYKDFCEPTKKIDWIDYFLLIANIVSLRSKDAQTKHGCVITDNNNRILGTGYNSFIRGMTDAEMPNLRPGKYKFFVHSEINALQNLTVNPLLYKEGLTAYITGRPCLNCLQFLHNNNVKNIYAQNRQGSVLEKDEETEFLYILSSSNINYYVVDPDFSWCTIFSS